MNQTIQNRRSWWQRLVGNPQQRQFWGNRLLVAVFLLALLAGFAAHKLNLACDTLLRLDHPAAQAMGAQISRLGVLFLFTILALSGIVVYLVYYMVDRVFGPMVAILFFIGQMSQGNYTGFRSLRKHDEFSDVMRQLNELAARLREKDAKNLPK